MKKKPALFLFSILISISAFSQSYSYDANGNLSSDPNKQISSIHYNYLNLVDTITYQDGRRIIYSYTSTGQKLQEQVLLANGTNSKKRDYIADYLYVNDTLIELHHEEGRSLPVNNSWEYQYHVKDHLGNVRSTLTSLPDIEQDVASYESNQQNGFLRYEDARRVNSVFFDHTHNGITQYSQRLNGSQNEKYGLAKSMSVMPGDTIKLQVFAKYVDKDAPDITAALSSLLSQIVMGTATSGTVIDGSGYSTNGNVPFPFAGLNNTSGDTQGGPKAYLNWLVFDRNFVFKTGGYKKVSTAARENGTNVSHEKLEAEFAITAPGYVYAYLSNEEANPLEVYFDDFSVTHTKGPLVQESDYDPFGLVFNEYSKENSVENNFLYNGKELQKDFDLNWSDYGARMYDAALGRWHVIDPLSEKYFVWSPYNYALNNPVRNIDPDGRAPSDHLTDNSNLTNLSTSPSTDPEDIRRQSLLRDGLDVLSQTREGKGSLEILKSSGKNHVYVAISQKKLFKDVGGKKDKNALGITATLTFNSSNATECSIVQNDNGHYKIVVSDKDSPFSSFNGVDVTDDIKNDRLVRLVAAVDIGDKYRLAGILGHEIQAHVNYGISEEQDHLVYTGTKEGYTFSYRLLYVRYLGKYIVDKRIYSKSGTSGFFLANELSEMALKEAQNAPIEP